MSVQTAERSPAQPIVSSSEAPPLQAGDHLSRPEFERRYEAHPEIKKAELVEGIVFMPSPVRFENHARLNSDLVTWLGTYRAHTPGTTVGDNATVILDFENEVQPDAFLRLDKTLGGRSSLNADDYIEGPPELVVEVAASSAAYDMHVKRRVYARSGAPEYVVAQAYEQRLDWFILREGMYETLAADEHGIIRSEVFPGLWLQTGALWSGDLARMLATLQEGLASEVHRQFVEGLKAVE